MVHTFNLNGCNIAVDGNSGSIHVLDDLSYKILSDMKELLPLSEVCKKIGTEHTCEEIEEAYKEIEDLKEQGLLFSEEHNIEEMVSDISKYNGIKALCLHISHDCNLECEYCFASKGDYNSGRSMMTKDVALKAVDYLVENCGHRKNIEIDFFGGEPLMNMDTVKEVVYYGKEVEQKNNKNFHFTITTNGILLNDNNIDFINEYMDNIVISIDGRKEVHDSIRYDRAGQGSYDRILPLAKKLISKRKGKSYFIRGTYTSRNLDFSKDVMHLAELGFKEISVEPVVGTGDELFIEDKDIPKILDEYEILATKHLQYLNEGKDIRFYHFNLDLYEGPCVYKRISACGAGFEYFAVSPEGHLYPCHQFVGQNEFIMGDVFSGVQNTKIRDEFRSNNILVKEKCRDCWAKLFCSGGCHANAWFSNKNILEPNDISCTLQKKRIECALMIQTKKQTTK